MTYNSFNSNSNCLTEKKNISEWALACILVSNTPAPQSWFSLWICTGFKKKQQSLCGNFMYLIFRTFIALLLLSIHMPHSPPLLQWCYNPRIRRKCVSKSPAFCIFWYSIFRYHANWRQSMEEARYEMYKNKIYKPWLAQPLNIGILLASRTICFLQKWI